MKKIAGVIRRSEPAGFPPGRGNIRSVLKSARNRLIVGLALLVGLLLLTGWIGLTHLLHTAPPSALATTTSLSQVEPPRKESSLAYDPIQHVVLLFGGTLLTSQGARTNETWTWNGQSWQQQHPTTSPPALQGSMVYDASSRQIILFLNQVQSGHGVANQMWSWDGSTWHRLQPPLMPEVLDASMTYDAARGQVLLFGGEIPDTQGGSGTLTNATWTWNGSIWQVKHPTTSPSASTGSSLAYDEASRQIVLYGGITQAGLSTETWTWNGMTWQQSPGTNRPSARQNALLIYDSATQQMLLFGGINTAGTQPAPGETWAWHSNGWVRVSATGAPADLYESAAYDDATRTVIVYAVHGAIDKSGQTGTTVPQSQTWTWNGTAWKLLP